MQLIMSGVLNITQLVGVSSSIWTMDRFGRRSLLLWGSLCMTISHIVIAALVGRFSNNWPAHRAEGWISVAFLLFYMLSFGASWGPVPWAVPSEIFPSSLRAKGVALSTCSNWLNNFIIVSSLPIHSFTSTNLLGGGFDSSSAFRGNWLWYLYLFCCVLFVVLHLGIFLYSRNEQTHSRGDGSCFQGCCK